jgi:hypothetical protein
VSRATTAVVVLLAFGGFCAVTGVGAIYLVVRAKKQPGVSSSSSDASPVASAQPLATKRADRMETFFAANKRPVKALTREDVARLAGTWEAGYASFELDRTPVDVAALPRATLTIEPSADGARVRLPSGPPRELAIEGETLRAPEQDGRPELLLRVEGEAITGELRGPSLHAEFRARRK